MVRDMSLFFIILRSCCAATEQVEDHTRIMALSCLWNLIEPREFHS